MQFRKLSTTGLNVDVEKTIDELRKALFQETPSIEKVHIVFENLFNEEIPKGLAKVFFAKFNKLTDKEKHEFIDNMLGKYNKYGEFGFATIVLQTLSRFRSFN